jgi:hypothetical protein
MKIKETIYDVTTQETTVIERELTQDEVKERKEAAEMRAKIDAEETIKAEAKTALLTKLGITAEEAALLLG